jgi:hypothetical protein
MKAVRALLIVLLNVGAAGPAAASPVVPAGTWPGVSDVLLNVVAAPVAACSSCGLNDSQQPGSVLVFPVSPRSAVQKDPSVVTRQ